MTTMTQEEADRAQAEYRTAIGLARSAREAADSAAEHQAMETARAWRRILRNRRAETPDEQQEKAERIQTGKQRAKAEEGRTRALKELQEQRAEQIRRWKRERTTTVVRQVVGGGLPELGKRH